MNNIKRGDIVVYKNKCMSIQSSQGDLYTIKDIKSGDLFKVDKSDMLADNKCIDNFYKFGEID